jgi:hypothetical protein
MRRFLLRLLRLLLCFLVALYVVRLLNPPDRTRMIIRASADVDRRCEDPPSGREHEELLKETCASASQARDVE